MLRSIHAINSHASTANLCLKEDKLLLSITEVLYKISTRYPTCGLEFSPLVFVLLLATLSPSSPAVVSIIRQFFELKNILRSEGHIKIISRMYGIHIYIIIH